MAHALARHPFVIRGSQGIPCAAVSLTPLLTATRPPPGPTRRLISRQMKQMTGGLPGRPGGGPGGGKNAKGGGGPGGFFGMVRAQPHML